MPGSMYSFGIAGSAPRVAIHLTDKAVEREIFLNPELKTAEAYMDKRLVMKDDTRVFDLLYLFSINRSGLAAHPIQQVLYRCGVPRATGSTTQSVGIAARNIRHHYDIPADFFCLWLDETMTYSCGYYVTPDISLQQAQIDKIYNVAAKLKLEPKMHVAEIGSGYGALAASTAWNHNVRVTSVLLSSEQISVAKARAVQEGVDDRVTFVQQDYRTLEGTYDRVVSIAMMEAIGVAEFDPYFTRIKRLTKPGGFALVHCIGRMSPPGTTAPFLRKYIFPAGYVPCAIGDLCLPGADRHLVCRLRELAHALLLDNQALARSLRRPPY